MTKNYDKQWHDKTSINSEILSVKGAIEIGDYREPVVTGRLIEKKCKHLERKEKPFPTLVNVNYALIVLIINVFGLQFVQIKRSEATFDITAR